MEGRGGIGSLARYETMDQVGEGTYGYVFRARDKGTGEAVALKRLIFHKEAHGFPLCAVREIKFLKSLSHKNIVKLKDIASSKGCEHLDAPIKSNVTPSVGGAANQQQQQHPQHPERPRCDDTQKTEDKDNEEQTSEAKDEARGGAVISRNSSSSKRENPVFDYLQKSGNLYLVFEYIEHDLGGLVDAKYKFNVKEIKCIMKQLFEVLDYLSERKVIHRDIKSSNILISNRHVVKLADFGLARSIVGPDGREGRIDLTNNVVTMWYKSPELLLGSTRYSHSVDMWSVGCVMAELELGRPLFPGKSEQQQFEIICKVMGTPSEETWPNVSLLPHYESFMKPFNKVPIVQTFRSSYHKQISGEVISLLERILVPDPTRRTSAKIALSNTFFNTPPLPPPNPADLPPLNIDPSVSLHEFETKQRRKAKDPFSAEYEGGGAKSTATATVTGAAAVPLPSSSSSLPSTTATTTTSAAALASLAFASTSSSTHTSSSMAPLPPGYGGVLGSGQAKTQKPNYPTQNMGRYTQQNTSAGNKRDREE